MSFHKIDFELRKIWKCLSPSKHYEWCMDPIHHSSEITNCNARQVVNNEKFSSTSIPKHTAVSKPRMRHLKKGAEWILKVRQSGKSNLCCPQFSQN